MFKYYYETAFASNRSDQEAVLEVSKHKSRVEEINSYIDFQFLRQKIPILGVWRLDYRKHLFFGTAEVQEATDYTAASGSTPSMG